MRATQKLAQYETALEIFDMLIADRSAAIAQEKANSAPDQARINILICEKVALRSKSRTMSLSGDSSSSEVIGIYREAEKNSALATINCLI